MNSDYIEAMQEYLRNYKRKKIVWITRGAMTELVRGRVELVGVPPHAVLQDVGYCPERNRFGLKYHSPHFDSVPEGQTIPTLEGVRVAEKLS